MSKQNPKEIMFRCELCGCSTLHRLISGDIDDNSSKVCTKCGLWEDYKFQKEEKAFDRYQDDF
jgi:uncharacterized Zn finger protein